MRKVGRKAVFLVVFLSSALLPLFCGQVSWTIEPETSVVAGRTSEIVYPAGIENDVNKYLSRLDWDIMPAWLAGIGVSMETGKKFRVYMDFQSAMPLSSGQMYDYDWLYTNLTDWSHRSEHDITLGFSFIGDIGLEKAFVVRDKWQMRLGFGYHVDSWSWKDAMQQIIYTLDNNENVYPQDPKPYQPGDPVPRNTTKDMGGIRSIDYRITYNVPYLSLVYRYSGTKLKISAMFKTGLVIAAGVDHHLLRTPSMYYYDIGIGGPWLSLDARTDFRVCEHGSIYVSAGAVLVPEFSGSTTYIDEYGYNLGTATGSAGFSYWRIQATLGYVFEL